MKKYLIAFGLAITSFLAAFFAGKKSGRDAVNKDNALAQMDMIDKAHTESKKARKEGEDRTDDAIKKSHTGDWSGFNDKL